MNIDKSKGIVYCHGCMKGFRSAFSMVARRVRTDTYLEGETVKCLMCDSTLGYTWDAPEFFHVSNTTKEDSND